MTVSGTFVVPPDHPALPGHFPGRPIVPGVVLLDHALTAIGTARPGERICALPAVKFVRPVRAGETVALACTAPGLERLACTCRVGADEVARFTVLLGPAP